MSSSLQSGHLATSLRAPDEFEAVVHEIQALEGRLGSTSQGGLGQACEEGPGLFAHFLKILSVAAVLATLPFSLFFAVKVVQVHQKIILKRSDHVYGAFCCRSTREQSSSGWVAS